jgi:4'-phosphopantetheinyl transferase EntD
MICGVAERRAFEDLPMVEGIDWECVAFSAKEAIYKCLYPLTLRFLDFKDVEIIFSSSISSTLNAGSFRARLCEPSRPGAELAAAIMGRWLVDAVRVYCGATLAQLDERVGAASEVVAE